MIEQHYINKYFNGHRLNRTVDWDPYNPLNLPPYTMRLLYRSDLTPRLTKGSATQISQDPNVWDYTYENNDWSYALFENAVAEVIGANTKNVTNMNYMFDRVFYMSAVSIFDTSEVTSMKHMFRDNQYLTAVPFYDTSKLVYMDSMLANCHSLSSIPPFDTSNVVSMGYTFGACWNVSSIPFFDTVSSMAETFFSCTSLSSVPLFDTSNVTNMGRMFEYCKNLTSIPPFDTTNVNNVNNTFHDCKNVVSGASAMYKQLSTKANPPSAHYATFSSCGIDTQQGLAELNKIPTAWGGLSGTNYSNTGNNTNTGNGGSNTGNNGSYTGGLN